MGRSSNRRQRVSPSRNPRRSAAAEALESRTLLSTATFAPAVRYDVRAFTRSFIAADFNNDGRPDIAAVNTADGTVLILLNDAHGSFTRLPVLHANLVRSIAAADFNHDGFTDLAVTSSDGKNAMLDIYFGLGNGTFATPPAHYPMVSGAPYMIAADLNGDGFADLVTVHRGRIGVHLNLGDGTFASPATYYEVGGYRPNYVAAADFNNDGVPDLAVSRGVQGAVTILLGNRSAPGTFGAPLVFPAGADPIQLAVGDFNRDGNQDIAVVNSGFKVAAVTVLLGNGDGTFRPRGSYGGGNFSDAITSADYDGDGIPDLVVGSFDSVLRLYPGNGDGTFAPPVTLSGAPFVEFLQTADFNGDGKPDVAGLPGTLKVLINTTGTVPTPAPSGQDQTIGAGAARSVTFTAPDDTRATVTLSGPGTATLHFLTGASAANPQALSLASISATGTTAATVLSFSARGGSRAVTVGSIGTDGAFKSILGPSTNLTGDLSIPGGAGAISLLSANNGTFTLGGGAGAATTLSVGQMNGETITSSGAFGKIQVQLDAGIHLTAAGIGRLSVGGALHDSNLTLTDGSGELASFIARRGIVNTLVNASGSIGTITARLIENSTVYAGVGSLPPGQALPAAPTDFVSSSVIRSVMLGRTSAAPSFSNSVIAAAALGNVNLGAIATANGGVAFGVAAHAINSLAGADLSSHRSFRLTKLASAQDVTAQLSAKGLNLQDFVVRIV